MRIFFLIENQLYKIRDILWSFPTLFEVNNPQSITYKFLKGISLTRPYSTIVLGVVIAMILPVGIFSTQQIVDSISEDYLIEAVVMGVDENNQIQQLPKVNPIIPSSIQLEKDIAELIYEPLIRYDSTGRLEEVLVSDIVRVQEGAIYSFTLKDNVYWHGGQEELEIEDVFATFDLLTRLKTTDADSSGLSVQGVDSAYVQAVSQMAWEQTGENEFFVCTLTADSSRDKDRPCSNVDQERPILSNFLELISFKIIPSEAAQEINIVNFNTTEPEIYSRPVGTGPFQYSGASQGRIELVRNNAYHSTQPQLSGIRFQYYKTEQEAISALQNSQVHSYVSTSSVSIRDMQEYPQINLNFSSSLDNQYWALYFNLREDNEGNALSKEFFQNPEIRRAISMSINRNRLLDSILGLGREAYGPISDRSDFFNAETDFPSFDVQRAIQILEEEGWDINSATGIREKDGVPLSFELTFVDNVDRHRMVDSILQDLENVGIELVKNPQAPEDLSRQYVLPKLYDSLLYGVGTFIDPDRYELFHSEETRLNFSSYVGSADTVVIKDGETQRIPKVDNLLDLGRKFDPLEAKEQRVENYKELQDLIADDVPAVFLYHPKFVYYTNQRLRNVELSNLVSLESRLWDIEGWYID